LRGLLLAPPIISPVLPKLNLFPSLPMVKNNSILSFSPHIICTPKTIHPQLLRIPSLRTQPPHTVFFSGACTHCCSPQPPHAASLFSFSPFAQLHRPPSSPFAQLSSVVIYILIDFSDRLQDPCRRFNISPNRF